MRVFFRLFFSLSVLEIFFFVHKHAHAVSALGGTLCCLNTSQFALLVSRLVWKSKRPSNYLLAIPRELVPLRVITFCTVKIFCFWDLWRQFQAPPTPVSSIPRRHNMKNFLFKNLLKQFGYTHHCYVQKFRSRSLIGFGYIARKRILIDTAPAEENRIFVRDTSVLFWFWIFISGKSFFILRRYHTNFPPN